MVSVQEILKSCLAGTKYNFKIVDNLIVITPDDKKKDEGKIVVSVRCWMMADKHYRE